MTNFAMVREFHQVFGVPVATKPTLLAPERQELRLNLIEEELQEYRDAIAAGDLVEAADALVDLLYVTYGAMLEHGLPANRLFAEVQRSNMTKLMPCDHSDRIDDGRCCPKCNGIGGTPIYRESDNKVLKGPNFELPRIKEILEEMA